MGSTSYVAQKSKAHADEKVQIKGIQKNSLHLFAVKKENLNQEVN